MKTPIYAPPFYVWHGEGECDNKCDTLSEARSVARWLETERKQSEVWIIDGKDRVVPTRTTP